MSVKGESNTGSAKFQPVEYDSYVRPGKEAKYEPAVEPELGIQMGVWGPRGTALESYFRLRESSQARFFYQDEAICNQT